MNVVLPIAGARAAFSISRPPKGGTQEQHSRPVISDRFLRRLRAKARQIAAQSLREAFPHARSDHQRTLLAERKLGDSAATYRRILREQTDIRGSNLLPLLALALARRGIDVLDLWDD